MERLSSPVETVQRSYDALVIGSGYGGGVAAYRLARAGHRVCVLERGRELHPGDYPNDATGLLGEIQVDLPIKHIGPDAALFDLRVYDDINVAVGCGLGGTSLINAGIALRPDERMFQEPVWPHAFRNEPSMARYFERAEAMLKPAPYPETPRRLDKFNALRRSAQASRASFAPVPMLVNFAPLSGGVNHAGVRQNECVGCGDCITGCNYGAKNTVLMNYLPAARAHGAQIFTGTSATNLTRTTEGWRVSFTCAGEARVVEARRVVLAAGSLGSTELLLRSRSEGLALSSALGHRFSGNGDAVGLLYNADVPVNAIGFGEAHAGDRAPVGTCSTGIVDYRAGRPLNQGMIMVDGAIPGAFAKWLPALLGALAAATGRHTDSGWVDRAQEKARELQSHLAGAYSGAVQRTQICLVVAHDDAGGTMSLEGDRLTIRWPEVGRQSPFEQADDAMLDAARALGATYIPNPIWHEWLGRKAITGHPLGGCPMADDARDGVVNHRGEVFSGESGTAVHPGLYVMDGAVVPRSLGVNPLLTITALAERACEHLVASERV